MTALPSIERPSLTFGSLRIFVSRAGTQVTGRVELPYPVSGRREIKIDYHSMRPDGSSSGGMPNKLDTRAAWRADIVVRWREQCARNQDISKTRMADRVAAGVTGGKCSGRSILLWAERYDAGGVNALRDRYVEPPKKVLTLENGRAADCVLLCAWWAFRIGDTATIDTNMMHAADGLLDRYDKSTILPTIDCYYAWPCDRSKFRFKPLARWSRYDFQTWLFRACDENDYRRAVKILEGAEVALLAPPAHKPSDIPDVKTRLGDVLHHTNRAAMHSLVDASASSEPQASEPRARATGSSFDAPPEPTLADLQAAKKAKHLRGGGFHRAAIETASRVETGIPAVAAKGEASTLSAFVAGLNDDYRRMFLRAAQSPRGSPDERQAIEQITVTWSLWFERLPSPVRRAFELDMDRLAREGRKEGAALLGAVRALVAKITANPALGNDLQLASRVPIG